MRACRLWRGYNLMNQRYVLAAILVAALAFAGYQVYELLRPAPATAPAAPAPPATAAASPPQPAGTMPYDAVAAPRATVGADAPFDPAVARRITAREAGDLLASGKQVVFVDTRTAVDGPIIRGAVQVAESDVERWARGVPKSAYVVVYCTCAHESTAEREVLALQRLGFQNAYALLDGLMAWESAGLPTEQAPGR
jgi:rhodanese-related sulfurtransferase